MTTDHYAEHREIALTELDTAYSGPGDLLPYRLAAAQVHATLALAAATHDSVIVEEECEHHTNGDGQPPAQWELDVMEEQAERAERRQLEAAIIEIARLTGTPEVVVRARITGTSAQTHHQLTGVASAVTTLELRLGELRRHDFKHGTLGDSPTRQAIAEHEVALAALTGDPGRYITRRVDAL